MTLWRQIILLGVAWSFVVICSLGWTFYNNRLYEFQNMLEVSRAFFKQIVLTREWNARHGGVYVFVDDATAPNPYLDVKDRDIPLEDGRVLTMINPAFMTRQLSQLATESNDVRIHITSLRPVRPQNAALPWEAEALRRFETGLPETGIIADNEFRYMAPLVTNRSCLQCHDHQNYNVGDIRGGISVTFPFIPNRTFTATAAAHTAIGLAGLLLIFLFGRQLSSVYRKLHELSTLDPLTQIFNRRHFLSRTEEEFHRAARDHRPIALIMIDVDYFKGYNDRYGHLAGDACLKEIVKAMQHHLRRPPDCFARYGGEEFIALLPETPNEGALAVAEKMRRSVEALKIENAKSICCGIVTVSIGVATAKAGQISYETLLKRTDDALYLAKRNGKNRVETAASLE